MILVTLRNAPVLYRIYIFGLLSAFGLLGCSSSSSSSGEASSGASGHSSSSGGSSAMGGASGGSPATAGTSGTEEPELNIELGEPTTILGPNNSLGLAYFPDEGTNIISYDPFTITLTDGLQKASYRVESNAGVMGDPLLHLTDAHLLFGPSTDKTTFDNGYAGISAVFRHTDGVLYGFYHAEDQENMGSLTGGIPGFYARIGLVYSADQGKTFTKAGYVLESVMPKRTPGNGVQSDQGVAEAGAVVSADGQSLYVYYTEHGRDDGQGNARPVYIGMARASLADWPPKFSTTLGPIDAFKKYHEGSFSTPGIGGADTPIIEPPDSNTSNALEGHVVYSASLKKYVMVYNVDAWEERTTTGVAKVSGVYYAVSDDGIHFRPSKTPLITDFGVAYPNLSVTWQASILFDAGSDTEGWLVYGFSPNFTTTNHYMMGRRLTLVAR